MSANAASPQIKSSYDILNQRDRIVSNNMSFDISERPI